MIEISGSTDIELQEAILKEIKKISVDWRKPGSNQWIDWKYYKQMKPQKLDAILVDDNGNYVIDEEGHPIMIPPEVRDEDQEDYIVVMIDDEDEKADGSWTVNIIIAVSIYIEDPDNQGMMVVQDILNRIWLHFAKKGIIAEKFEMESGAKKRFNLENIINFYEGVLMTKWKLPMVFPEEVMELS